MSPFSQQVLAPAAGAQETSGQQAGQVVQNPVQFAPNQIGFFLSAEEPNMDERQRQQYFRNNP